MYVMVFITDTSNCQNYHLLNIHYSQAKNAKFYSPYIFTYTVCFLGAN